MPQINEGEAMHHFFADTSNIDPGAGTARIVGIDVNHIRNALRMKPGEQILISDGQGQDYLGQIKELSAEAVLVENLLPVSGRGLPSPFIRGCQRAIRWN